MSAKKKIGFIDLFIDEWHANNYPAWFKSSVNGGNFELGLAYEVKNNGGRPLDKWCADLGMTPAKSIEEVVAESDCICVLAPSNPEVHEELAQLPLASGKPVYIDKPFAPSKEAAERIFARAKEFRTPLMSSSALRYGTELLKAKSEMFSATKPDYVTVSGGGRSFEEYGIHQIEMLVSLMGTGAKRVMQMTNNSQRTALIDYADNRRGVLTYSPMFGFTLSAASDEKTVQIPSMSNFFPTLIDEMLAFFATGKSPIPGEETIEIAAILEAAVKGISSPFTWIDVK